MDALDKLYSTTQIPARKKDPDYITSHDVRDWFNNVPGVIGAANVAMYQVGVGPQAHEHPAVKGKKQDQNMNQQQASLPAPATPKPPTQKPLKGPDFQM